MNNEFGRTAMPRRDVLATGASVLALALAGTSAKAAGSPGLTTHMLDITTGKPAEGVHIDFSVADADGYHLVRSVVTNSDGRNAEPLLTAETMKVGEYQLVFHIADYFTKLGTVLPTPPFLDRAVIQFGISDPASHYHVPLLASPWSFTTYRGS